MVNQVQDRGRKALEITKIEGSKFKNRIDKTYPMPWVENLPAPLPLPRPNPLKKKKSINIILTFHTTITLTSSLTHLTKHY